MAINNFLNKKEVNLILSKILPALLALISFIRSFFPAEVHYIFIIVYFILMFIMIISLFYYNKEENKLNNKVKELNEIISKKDVDLDNLNLEISKLTKEIQRNSNYHNRFKGGLIEFIRVFKQNFIITAKNVIKTSTFVNDDWSLESIGYDICMHCCNFLSTYGEVQSSHIGVGLIEYSNNEFELIAHSGEGVNKETFQIKIHENSCKYYYKRVYTNRRQVIFIDNEQIDREFKKLWKDIDTSKFRQYIALPICDSRSHIHGVFQIMISGSKNLANDTKELEELIDKYLNIYINMLVMTFTAGNEIKKMLSIQ